MLHTDGLYAQPLLSCWLCLTVLACVTHSFAVLSRCPLPSCNRHQHATPLQQSAHVYTCCTRWAVAVAVQRASNSVHNSWALPHTQISLIRAILYTVQYTLLQRLYAPFEHCGTCVRTCDTASCYSLTQTPRTHQTETHTAAAATIP